MGDPARGWIRKYDVRRVDGTDARGQKHEGCEYFVLDLDHDPHAFPALQRYAQSCRREYPLLADDLVERLRTKAFGGNQPPSGVREDPGAPRTGAVPHATESSSSDSAAAAPLAPSRDLKKLVEELQKRIDVADRVAANGRAPHVAVYVPFELAEQILAALDPGDPR